MPRGGFDRAAAHKWPTTARLPALEPLCDLPASLPLSPIETLGIDPAPSRHANPARHPGPPRTLPPCTLHAKINKEGLLVILDPATSGGLISASSRFFPGLILIDRPENPFNVAEALIHEGAPQKFFDLVITHDFLGADIAEDRRVPSVVVGSP
jgi:hypothetical protein